MSEISKFKELLLFEVQKAFYDERGKGARYRLTTAGVSFFKDRIKEGMDDVEAIKGYLTEHGLVGGLEYTEDAVSFSVRVNDCCLKEIRDYFSSANMQPLGCPIANVIMNALELKSGLSPELLPIDIEGDACSFTLAKMATSDVVER
ncbi:MAG: hypothetical protein HPY74_12110 [Firmicutes bacterium]|nr:hypothetical protein [Bacillota bacterium]